MHSIRGLLVGILTAALSLQVSVLSQPAQPVAPTEGAQRQMEAVAARLGKPMIAEAPTAPRVILDQHSSTEPLDELKRLCAEYEMHYRLHRDYVLLHRRYFRPESDLESSPRELLSLVRVLHGLVHPFTPYPLGQAVAIRQNQFAASLSRQQREAMQRGRVPFTALSAEQQRAWIELCYAHAFCDLDHSLENTLRTLGAWSQCTIAYEAEFTHHLPTWVLRQPPTPGNQSGFAAQFQLAPGVAGGPPEREGTGEELRDEPPRREAWAGRIVALPKGSVSLSAVVKCLERAAEIRVEYPDAIGARRVLVTGGSLSAGRLATALEQLVGYELQATRGGAWRLELRRPKPVRSARELQREVRRLVPPQFRLFAVARRRDPRYFSAWRQRQLNLVLDEVERSRGSNTERVRCGALSPELQNRLAATVAMTMLGGELEWFLVEPEPQWYLVEPHKGWFTWEGPLETPADRNARHPVLLFMVTRPDGKDDGWGWAVGSSYP